LTRLVTRLYKNLEVIGDSSLNGVSIQTLDVKGITILQDVSINGTIFYSSTIGSNATIDSESDISINSLYVINNTTISGDIYLNGRLLDENGDIYIGAGSSGSGIFSSNDADNYYTTKNVNIGTNDICDNYTLNVKGGVRLFNNNSSDEYYIPSNDWIPDLSNNIYYTNGKVGIGTLNSTSYILDVNGGVRIKNSYDSLNVIDISDGWSSGENFIYYNNKVIIGGSLNDDDSKLYVNGKITADSLELLSDKRLKYNIKDLSGSLSILRQLNPKIYNKYSTTQCEIGFIANDISVLDDISYIVSKTGEYYSLNYNSLFSLSIQCIKDLDVELQNEKLKNDEIMKRLLMLEEKMDLILNK